MSLKLPELPYELEALEPWISAETLSFHHGKHHQAYVDQTNRLIQNTPLENLSLDEIVLQAQKDKNQALFNQASQAWNHDFYWKSLSPHPSEKSQDLTKALERDFGGFDAFKLEFQKIALSQFGSGWTWLISQEGSLSISKTSNAERPLIGTPLFVLDVWEHAYYIDYRNRRADYISAVLDNLIHWGFVSHNFSY